MALKISHDCFESSYSTFNVFREDLGRQIGINLQDYAGWGFGGGLPLSSIPHEIMPLLNHSDCDGELTPEECKQVAKGLQDILDGLEHSSALIKSQKFPERIFQFIQGLLAAYMNNEPVIFS
jgi:hypothetical protein